MLWILWFRRHHRRRRRHRRHEHYCQPLTACCAARGYAGDGVEIQTRWLLAPFPLVLAHLSLGQLQAALLLLWT